VSPATHITLPAATPTVLASHATPVLESVDRRLLGTVVAGVALVVATGLAGGAAGLTGGAAFAAPLLVGVAVGAGVLART